MISHVIDFVLIEWEPSHIYALDRGNTHFYKENRVGCIAFNFEVIRYKTLLDLFNPSPRFSRDVATLHLTPIQDNKSD